MFEPEDSEDDKKLDGRAYGLLAESLGDSREALMVTGKAMPAGDPTSWLDGNVPLEWLESDCAGYQKLCPDDA